MSGKTVISRTTAFAAGTDLTTYRDWRIIADLVKDDDTREASQAATEGNALVGKALRVASGQIEAAIYRGGRYTKEDIDNIITPVGGGADSLVKDFLIELTCTLAFWYLLKRRKPDINPRVISGVPEALATIQALELGEMILPFQETVDASVMDYAPLDPNRAKANVNAQPLSTQANRLFGTRSRTVTPN